MRVLTQIGEASAMVDGQEYLVRPSFAALASLGDPEILELHIEKICLAYHLLTKGGITPNYESLSCCANMLDTCSDFPKHWLGECVVSGNKIKWRQGKIPVYDLIIIAHHCVKWGVSGDSKFRNKPKPPKVKKLFDPAEFVALLVDEFSMSKSDSWECTMTEFQRLCEQRQKKNWGDRPEPPTKESAIKSFEYANEAIARARKLGIKPAKKGRR
jgi:Family of unknown function (DUF6246)